MTIYFCIVPQKGIKLQQDCIVWYDYNVSIQNIIFDNINNTLILISTKSFFLNSLNEAVIF